MLRRVVKRTSGWIHATLILAILLPVFYVVGVQQRSAVSQTLYFRCLLIAFPVVVTDIAVEKCKGLFSYLVVCALAVAATGALGWVTAGSLHQSGEAMAYVLALLGEAFFVAARRLAGRLRKKREKEVMEKENPNIVPSSDALREPSFWVLLYFGFVYVLALNVDSPEVCNGALFSTAIYGVIALLYHYVDGTETYLSLNKRVCNLPSRRIYGIGGGMLAVFLLLLMAAALPAFLAIPGRTYRDVRDGLADGNREFAEWLLRMEVMENGAGDLPDWMGELGEPEPAPVWVAVLFYVAAAVIFLFLAVALAKAVFGMFRDFRGGMDENGDIVEELEEADMGNVGWVKVQRERHGLSERERIRKQYRRFIRRHRKERPGAYESPTEIEVKAGVAQSEEGKEMHGRYEYARYGREEG